MGIYTMHKVINSSQLDNRCWSADRQFDHCETCQRVDRCKLPEAKNGRIRNQKKVVEFHKQQLREAKKKLAELEK
jgi:hypothetical protein